MSGPHRGAPRRRAPTTSEPRPLPDAEPQAAGDAVARLGRRRAAPPPAAETDEWMRDWTPSPETVAKRQQAEARHIEVAGPADEDMVARLSRRRLAQPHPDEMES